MTPVTIRMHLVWRGGLDWRARTRDRWLNRGLTRPIGRKARAS